MSVTAHVVNSYTSNYDGKVYGDVSYAGNVVASLTEGSDPGKRNDSDFEKWARGVATEHKASISPEETRVVTQKIVV